MTGDHREQHEAFVFRDDALCLLPGPTVVPRQPVRKRERRRGLVEREGFDLLPESLFVGGHDLSG
jgi:hypothetical protein